MSVQSSAHPVASVLGVVDGLAGSRPQVPRMFKNRVVNDAGLVARQFATGRQPRGLARIMVSHGAIIEEGAALLLQRLADKLSPQR